MTIEVKEETNGSFTISWDEKDPQESIFNTWTSKDFENAIQKHLDNLKEQENV
jgi:hypothetical protein